MNRALVVLCAALSGFLPRCLAEDGKAKYPRVLVGAVKDVAGKPIAGARVEYGYFSAAAAEREFVLTDAEGRYRLESNRAGRDFRAGVSAHGYAPNYVDGVIPGPAEAPTEHNVELRPGVGLNLRITTQAGAPLKGLRVRPTTPSSGFYSSFSSPIPHSPFPGEDRARITDADGRVTFEDLPPIPGSDFPINQRRPTPWLGLEVGRARDNSGQTVSLSAEDAAVAKPGEAIIVRVSDSLDEQPREGVVRGRVIDKQTKDPIHDFLMVRRYWPTAEPFHTDDGRFVSGGDLRPGRDYETRIFAEGYAVGVARPVAVVGPAIHEEVFALEKHPSFHGRLVDPEGKPLPGVELVTGAAPKQGRGYVEWSTLESYADGHHSLQNVLRVTTDENGEFIVPEAPDRPAALIVKTAGFARQIIMPANRPEPDADGVVSIPLPRAARLIVVANRDTQLGKLADSVSIGFDAKDGFEHMYHSSALDEKGIKIYDSMAPGDYLVSLYSGNGSTYYPCYTLTVTLQEGEETRISLGDMTGALTLRGDAPPFATVRIEGSGSKRGPTLFAVHANVDGAFELRDLPPGVYRVNSETSSASAGYHSRRGSRRTIEVVEDTYVDLRVPPTLLQKNN